MYAEFHNIAIPRTFFIEACMRLHKTWVCPKCGDCFDSRASMRRHNITMHEPAKNRPKPYSWECPICNKVFKTMHERDHHKIDTHGKYTSTKYHYHYSVKQWVCKYCSAVYDSRRKLYQHYAECVEKLKLPVDSLGRSYNPIDKKKTGATIRRRFIEGSLVRKPCSEETRRKLSIARKKQLANGTGSSTWVNPHIHRSYAEQYFYDIVSKQLGTTINWKNNYRVCGYLLDFANLSTKVYFEVDGESHYTVDGLAYDAKRTSELAASGWFLIGRIRWKSYKKLSEDDRKKIVDSYLTAFVSSDTNVLPPIKEYSVDDAILKKHKTTPKDIKKRQIEIEAYLFRRDIAEQHGLIRSDGHIDGKGIPNSEWNNRKSLILNCGVDLMKFGWVGRVVDATGLSKRIIERTIQRFHDEFDGKYFRRKWNPVEHKT